MQECPGSKIFKVTTRVRKPGHRPPVVALRPPACDVISRDVQRTQTASVEPVVATKVPVGLDRAGKFELYL